MKNLIFQIVLMQMLTSCYVYEFFKADKNFDSDEEYDPNAEVLGLSLGAKAGDKNDAALAEVYAVTTSTAPAPVRPDPDLFARRLLRQFRVEGSTLAREIGRIEDYRPLLGGASQDFKTIPSETYDATSVLANLKVAEELCKGLVNPNGTDQPGWSTILPNPASDIRSNLKYLMQRFTGLANNKISDTAIDELEDILNANKSSGNLDYSAYVAPCAALALDATSMLM